MVGSIILGFGIGLATRGCMRLFFDGLAPNRLSRSSDSGESLRPQHALGGPPAFVPSDEGSANQGLAGHICRSDDEPDCFESKAEEFAQQKDSTADIELPDESPASKNWYLIRTSRGLLRICRCRAGTSSTVAGPFVTKQAASTYKKRYSSAGVLSPSA